MTTVWNIWMICLELNWFVYDPSWMLHLTEFVWTLRSLVWVVFNKFSPYRRNRQIEVILLAIKSAFFITLSLYPLSFFANTPFKSPFFFVTEKKHQRVSIERDRPFPFKFWAKNRLFLRPQLSLKSKTISNQERIRLFSLPWNYPNKWTVPLSLYPLSFFANTPFKAPHSRAPHHKSLRANPNTRQVEQDTNK